MAHPAKMLKELKEHMPGASIDYWVFGIFHTTRCNKADGNKGLLAASKESLVFKSGGSGEESYIVETPLREVRKVEAELKGTINMTIHLVDGSHMEMSYISRGNPKEFIRFLEIQGESSQDGLLTSEKTDQ